MKFLTKSLLIILFSLFCIGRSYGSTTNQCDVFLSPTTYFDFNEIESSWMSFVIKRLRSLILERIKSGQFKNEREIYSLVSLKSGIHPSNVNSHFAGRVLANHKFASAVAEVLAVDIDIILARDFFERFFETSPMIREHHFHKRYFYVLRNILKFLFWSRESKVLNPEQLKKCLKDCSTEMLIEELRLRGLYIETTNIQVKAN